MYKISPQQLENVLNYLAKKPYIEVAPIINELSHLEEIKEDGKEKSK